MRTIRGGMGLGDALYVQAVARHLAAKGERLQVRTAWPDVFRYLPVETAPFTRQGINILAHYSARKAMKTKQFDDCCISAGITEPVELKIDWRPITDIGRTVKRKYPTVLVALPRAPMGRTDGMGASLLPDCAVIQRVINRIKDDALIVQVGAGEALYRYENIHIDYANRTDVCELMDLALEATAFLGYVSFFVPLAESFDKLGLFVWSRRGLRDRHEYVRRITPQKVLYKPSSKWILDDATDEQINAAADALLQ